MPKPIQSYWIDDPRFGRVRVDRYASNAHGTPRSRPVELLPLESIAVMANRL